MILAAPEQPVCTSAGRPSEAVFELEQSRQGGRTFTGGTASSGRSPWLECPQLDTLSGMSTEPAQGQFAFELLKLLLQVAWADDDVAHEESAALLSFAQKNRLPADEIDLLAACLAGKAPLPPPNIGFLKERRVEVLRALKAMLVSDLHVGTEEDAILGQISALLR